MLLFRSFGCGLPEGNVNPSFIVFYVSVYLNFFLQVTAWHLACIFNIKWVGMRNFDVNFHRPRYSQSHKCILSYQDIKISILTYTFIPLTITLMCTYLYFSLWLYRYFYAFDCTYYLVTSHRYKNTYVPTYMVNALVNSFIIYALQLKSERVCAFLDT